MWLHWPKQDEYVAIWATVRAPVFGKHQVFGTSEHYRKAHGSLSGWMNYNYTACCWFPTYNNILILPSQFWQISFESYWSHCSKCRILVLLRYKWGDNKMKESLMLLHQRLQNKLQHTGDLERQHDIIDSMYIKHLRNKIWNQHQIALLLL